MPPTAVGRITRDHGAGRVAPSAMPPSRRLDGTSSSTSSVARAISGSITIERPTDAAIALWPLPTTSRPKMKMPIDDRRHAGQHVQRSRIVSATCGGANSVLKIAISTPTGTAISVAMPVMISVPTIAFLIPPPVWPNGAGDSA